MDKSPQAEHSHDKDTLLSASASLMAASKALVKAGMAYEAEKLLFQAVQIELSSPEIQACWGGPLNGQTGRMAIVTEVVRATSPECIVETGTFRGVTTQWFADEFGLPVHSCEIERLYHLQAKHRLNEYPKVFLKETDSINFLKEFCKDSDSRNCFFYLDTHWQEELPLRDELRMILKHCPSATVMIDDFRVPDDAGYGWDDYGPGKRIQLEILFGLLPEGYRIYFPVLSSSDETGARRGCCVLATSGVLEDSKLLRGGDYLHWLRIQNDFAQENVSGSETTSLGEDAPDQSRIINDLRQEISRINGVFADQKARLYKELSAKEAVITELGTAVASFRKKKASKHRRQTNPTLGQIKSLRLALSGIAKLANDNRKRLFSHLRPKPKLGVLFQHAPRRLRVPPYRYPNLGSEIPRISLVTPSFAQGRFIERTIQSVLSQNYPALEYVVQDGGSTDETLSILRKYDSRIARWRSESDSGQSQAINRGFDGTSGDIMAWLNSDDLLLPGSLHRVADFFRLHPQVDVLYGNRILIDENDMQIGRWIMPGHDEDVLSWADYVPQETLFWRRSIWNKAGGKIDESFPFAMDWDLIIRFREAGAKFAHLPHFIGAFRVHPEQKTSAKINSLGALDMERIRMRIHGRIPSFAEVNRNTKQFLKNQAQTDFRYSIFEKVSLPFWRSVEFEKLVP